MKERDDGIHPTLHTTWNPYTAASGSIYRLIMACTCTGIMHFEDWVDRLREIEASIFDAVCPIDGVTLYVEGEESGSQ